MTVAIDVHYRNDIAKVAAVVFEEWQDETPLETHTIVMDETEEYIPGEFYKRELPCILKILEQFDLDKVNCIIVDGYVYLDDNKKAGLGMYLYDALDGKVPVVGVAKRHFKDNDKWVREVLRGESKNPIYITAVDLDIDIISLEIKKMAGKYRIPDLLRIMDRLTKE